MHVIAFFSVLSPPGKIFFPVEKRPNHAPSTLFGDSLLVSTLKSNLLLDKIKSPIVFEIEMSPKIVCEHQQTDTIVGV